MLLPQMLPSSLSTSRRAALIAARPLLSWLCDLPQYDALYQRMQGMAAAPFQSRALRALEITVAVKAPARTRVPASGPLIVAANHPRGIADGLALAEIVGRYRQDVRVLTTHMLQWLPDLRELCLFVNAFSEAAPESRAGVRQAIRWLDRGGALIVFPAGEVAHRQWQTSDTPPDATWRDTVGRMALSTGAAVIPAFISGRNRDIFYRAGQCHRTLRTVLLARELLALRRGRIAVALGTPLQFDRHATGRERGKAVTAVIRAEVERLGDRSGGRTPPAVVNGRSVTDLRSEVEALRDRRLIEGGSVDVYCATADRIPALLREIGRLREITFRSVGEGTGLDIDLDRFDRHYLHLFAWDREAEAVAGAYRLGPVDNILAQHGLGGLYTSTLFRFDLRLLNRLGPAVELGRSFVRAEYQRSSSVLMLLWKAIARFVSASDRYRVLFGPVSISARYSDTSRELLQAFLVQHARHQELSELVSALTPPPPLRDTATASADLQQLEHLIAGAEPDGKGMPVLLRQYLRLNAKLLAFNVDPGFGDALDALMMVDLADVDRAILTRYFGREGAARVVNRRPLPDAA